MLSFDNVKVNDRVKTRSLGEYNLPMSLNGEWATVLEKTTRGNIKVQMDTEGKGYTRLLKPSNVIEHVKTSS